MAKEIEEVSVCQMANQPIQINGICAQIRPQVNIKKQTKYEVREKKVLLFQIVFLLMSSSDYINFF